MTDYRVVVRSSITGISQEALRIFLQLTGYSVMERDGELYINAYEYKTAHNIEADLMQKFEVIVIKNGIMPTRVVYCDTFKESGKWQSEELVHIPIDTPEWDVHTQVKKYRQWNSLHYVGRLGNHVPFMVPRIGDDQQEI